MAEKDAVEKTLEAYNDVFADIVNVLLFQGERVVKEEELEDETPRSIYKADGKLHEQERDTAKYWKDCNVQIALYGFENQTKSDADMALRVISYDGAAYRSQLLGNGPWTTGIEDVRPDGNSTPRRYPVVTLVLYFGEKHWNKPLSLKECLDIPDKLKPFVSDYRINLFEIAWLEEEQVELFTSDFKIVADYFVQMRKNKEYRPSEEVMRHVDEVLKLMTVLTGDNRFEEVLNESGKGDVKKMCEVLDRVEARGEARGKAIGKAMGEKSGRESGLYDAICSLMRTVRCSADQAMDMLEIPAADRGKYLSKMNAN